MSSIKSAEKEVLQNQSASDKTVKISNFHYFRKNKKVVQRPKKNFIPPTGAGNSFYPAGIQNP